LDTECFSRGGTGAGTETLVSLGANDSPTPNVPSDFSASFVQDWNFPGGMTTFYFNVDDGMRLYIDGLRRQDDWTFNPGYRQMTTLITPGVHRVRVEFRDSDGTAGLDVRWAPM
jgi:PA14 domain